MTVSICVHWDEQYSEEIIMKRKNFAGRVTGVGGRNCKEKNEGFEKHFAIG